MKIMTLEKTQKIAEDLARRLPARVYALVGELGSGKTTFTQFFLRALGVTELIASPTFVIIKSYKLTTKNYKLVYHIDCYRLENPKELEILGFKEIIENPQNIVIIEWADRVKNLLPPDALWLYFEHGVANNERKIVIKTP